MLKRKAQEKSGNWVISFIFLQHDGDGDIASRRDVDTSFSSFFFWGTAFDHLGHWTGSGRHKYIRIKKDDTPISVIQKLTTRFLDLANTYVIPFSHSRRRLMVYQSSQLSKCFQTLIAGRAEKKAAAHSAEATTTHLVVGWPGRGTFLTTITRYSGPGIFSAIQSHPAIEAWGRRKTKENEDQNRERPTRYKAHWKSNS